MSDFPVHNKIQNQFIDVLTISGIAAAAGCKIVVAAITSANKDLVSIEWGGQSAVPVHNIANVIYVQEFYITTPGTHDIVLTFTGYTNVNAHWCVLTPETAFDPTASEGIDQYYSNYPETGSLTEFAQPSLTSPSIGANDRILNFLAVAGENRDGIDQRETEAVPVSPLTLLDEAVHDNKSPNQTLSATATGTGAIVTAFTITNDAAYHHVQIVVRETPYVVNSINGGNPTYPGQTVEIETTGFESKPTSATGSYASSTVTATIGDGTENSFEITIQDRVSGAPWPKDGTSIAWTFSNDDESATGSQVMTIKPDEDVQTFDGAITESYYIGGLIYGDGIVVEGGELEFEPYDDLTIDEDTNHHVSSLGSFDSWYRPPGADSNIYYYHFTITDAGVVIEPGGTSEIVYTPVDTVVYTPIRGALY